MKIAFLGWGSLVWDLRELKVKGKWKIDGPLLPIEYARKSNDGRITLVIYPGVKDIQTLWTYADNEDLTIARKNLQKREGTPNIKRIGYLIVETDESFGSISRDLITRIRAWGKNKELDVVLWTDLDSNYPLENIIDYLNQLDANIKKIAGTYIQRTPKQVKTEMRPAIEQELGFKQSLITYIWLLTKIDIVYCLKDKIGLENK